MEDDVDWDVNVRKQLLELARGARFIQEYAESTQTRSPYGDHWDVLWIGHCGAPARRSDQRLYVIRDDPTVVPPELLKYGSQVHMSPAAVEGTNNRLIYRNSGGRCLFAYAVTLEAARLFLNIESLSGDTSFPADRALSRVCGDRRFDARCISPFPTLFGTHKAVGPMEKDSDRRGSISAWRDVGETDEVVFSTRLNMASLLGLGDKSKLMIKSQWPKQTIVKEFGGELDYPAGKGIFVKREDFVDPPKT